MQTTNNKKFKSPLPAYTAFLFQTFFKRPFGYIIAILYVVYLAIILLVVPASLQLEPLFIWHIGGFNMPIFNLFFIGASAASIAVAVFRTGRDDGTDLNLSAKPLTKNSMVLIKTFVYLSIMLIICVFSTSISALIKPIFGTYNETMNPTGITDVKYVGIILSLLVGNIISMLFFGGISVLFSIIGNQVITIIGTVAIVFAICIINIIFPFTVQSASTVLSEKYNAEMLGYSCNTLHQYEHMYEDQTPLNFAAIQCSTNDAGEEEYHFDTKTYWELAEKQSNRKITNYFDFAKQLSTPFNSFGLDESRLQQASRLVIGTNSNFTYNILGETHVDDPDNVSKHNYPISYYSIREHQGKTYPLILMLGGNMSLSTSNWYLYTTVFKIDFNSINYLSNSASEMLITEEIWEKYARPYKKMSDLSKLSNSQKAEIAELYDGALGEYDPEINFSIFARDYIRAHSSHFIDDWDSASPQEQYTAISKIHMGWAVLAQARQNEAIINYFKNKGKTVTFPFSTKDTLEWYQHEVASTEGSYVIQQKFNGNIFTSAIAVDGSGVVLPTAYSRLASSKMEYAETYKNLYQYSVSNFFNVNVIIGIWMVVSCCLFTTSVIVYKRTDFK